MNAVLEHQQFDDSFKDYVTLKIDLQVIRRR